MLVNSFGMVPDILLLLTDLLKRRRSASKYLERRAKTGKRTEGVICWSTYSHPRLGLLLILGNEPPRRLYETSLMMCTGDQRKRLLEARAKIETDSRQRFQLSTSTNRVRFGPVIVYVGTLPENLLKEALLDIQTAESAETAMARVETTTGGSDCASMSSRVDETYKYVMLEGRDAGREPVPRLDETSLTFQA